ncbi:helicase-related protein [soil metagenome]
MPQIFDNIDLDLGTALQTALGSSERADFCVGYFNLRGWRSLDSQIERWSGEDGQCCRLMVGMPSVGDEQAWRAFASGGGAEVSQKVAFDRKKELAEAFRRQLQFGAPTNADEAGLRRLVSQLRARKVRVKLFTRHSLHAKLYLLFRPDPVQKAVGYVGSSNLTMAGLAKQGELNVDVTDHDACMKLASWFEARWEDRFCIDISDELIQVIDESWAREQLVSPYLIYLKMAYHLSHEARRGEQRFRIPAPLDKELLEFQVKAVQMAAQHVVERNGVLLADVVGLGKTIMATALAAMLEDEMGLRTLIVCPVRLEPMWKEYRRCYGLRGDVITYTSLTPAKLPGGARYSLVVVDESHNFRNREGARYRVLKDFCTQHESKLVLLSATPYNKSYRDLASQLRLFLSDEKLLSARPEKLIQRVGGEQHFVAAHQCPPNCLAAFDKSEDPEDWRDLMKNYMVRRTRSFIKKEYGEREEASGRDYLLFNDNSKSYFPKRTPCTVHFAYNDHDPKDPYAQLYSPAVVAIINGLTLPRYGLGNYKDAAPPIPPNASEQLQLENLGRAGKRLMGFCRSGLFKRLESSGEAFLQSLQRHVVRNAVYIHALENGLPLPVGTQNVGSLSDSAEENDADVLFADPGDAEQDGEAGPDAGVPTQSDLVQQAADTYDQYRTQFGKRFKWVRADLFRPELLADLRSDNDAILNVIALAGRWDPDRDTKLHALHKLVARTHPGEKVLVFSQFADTVEYLARELRTLGIENVEAASGRATNPTELAWRFSPHSNHKEREYAGRELRVLLATDVLSEGQNLQDAHVVVNYDLPWAIIRLIQRAGRVDRIGQRAETIFCYSFVPAEGIETIIRLRSRVRRRLTENAEVVGTDESFFEDDQGNQRLLDLYNEKSSALEGVDEGDVDEASQALQIWNLAVREHPELAARVEAMPDVVYSAKSHDPKPVPPPAAPAPHGSLVYVQVNGETDQLLYVDKNGETLTRSHSEALRLAACAPDTPATFRPAWHHDAVAHAVKTVTEQAKQFGAGGVGHNRTVRARVYAAVYEYALSVKGTVWDNHKYAAAVALLLRAPLKESARGTLRRMLRAHIQAPDLARLVVGLMEDGALCYDTGAADAGAETRIICSLALTPPTL